MQWLGAVQAQDYGAAKWALGLRSRGVKDADIEQAFTDGTILRTHLMRPTWHFVRPTDIRWILELTAPRVHSVNAYYYRKYGLNEAIFSRSNEVMQEALQGGNHLTRSEIATLLQQAGIDIEGSLRLGYLMMQAELNGVVCSGPRRGKQFTYALLDERVPEARTLGRNEALAELTVRYFTGHGPGTLNDFVWWSGFSVADAKAGLEMVGSRLIQEKIDGLTYWLAKPKPFAKDASPTAYLLPNYDEYTIGYRDHDIVFDASQSEKRPVGSVVFGHVLVIDGQVAGAWKRELSKDGVAITVSTFSELTDAERQAVGIAADKYGEFLGMPAIVL